VFVYELDKEGVLERGLQRYERLASFRILADLVREDRKAVSWTSVYSCRGVIRYFWDIS
jgi:hypothetical protein